MCRKHHAVRLYAEPGADAPMDRRLGYIFRGLGEWVRCAKCDLTGHVRNPGKGVRWHTPGTVGHLSRASRLASARSWNAGGPLLAVTADAESGEAVPS